MKINPLTTIDFYKADHRRQYPKGTTEVYSNFTPRSSHLAKMSEYYDNTIVFFGLQFFIYDFLIKNWNENFFYRNKIEVLEEYKKRMDTSLGKDSINIEHISKLHDLQYLPIKIKALPEGTKVPIGIPVLTIVTTHPDFFWLTNYLETAISCYLWRPITSATIAFEYKKILIKYTMETGGNLNFIPFQAHDFSYRGMSNPLDASLSGAAHLTSFCGTDSVSAIDLVENYYYADVEKELIGCSVPATEHSVMCMGTEENELETFKRLIAETYPSGIVSIVSDTWDFWKVITQYALILKNQILIRNGKVVFRPDSGDPVKIIIGDLEAPKGSPEYKGTIECLWDIFGGTTNSNGYKVLDNHVGLIYGDSITLERAEKILYRLKEKGFESSNIVFGVGSFTYQYTTRDTFGFAMKATSGVVNGERVDIFKNPKTDNGTKKSAKGLLRVEKENGKLVLYDQQTLEQEEQGLLKTVFYNGEINKPITFDEIRKRIEE